MTEGHIECPSGLVGEVRGLKTKEANLLADRQAMRSGSALDAILSSCWLRTIDPGPYAIPEDGKPDWSKVLIGDRLYVFMRIRAATFGEEYAFPVLCESCRERFEWEVKLCDLPIKPLPEASKSALANGGRIETYLRDGKKAWFKLMTGADEVRAARIVRQQPGKVLLTALGARIVEIEGVKPEDRMRFLDDLDFGEANDIIRVLDEHDGGVETSLEVECTHCFASQEVRLPFGREFLMPKRCR